MYSDEIINGLETIVIEKNKVFSAFENRYASKIDEFEKKQREEFWAFSKAIREENKIEWELAKKEKEEAEANYKKARDEKNIESAKATMKFPEGSIVVRWEKPRWSYNSNEIKRGERAKVEIFRDGDEIPDNMRWSRPYVGKVIYRYLKKDGTTGKKFETGDWDFHLESELLPSEKAALDKKDSFIADGV